MASKATTPFYEECPSCTSRNVRVWEKTWPGGDVSGGKDCLECYAMSRRWYDEGSGEGIWTHGPGIEGNTKVSVVIEIMRAELKRRAAHRAFNFNARDAETTKG